MKDARKWQRALERATEILGYDGTDEEIWDLAEELAKNTGDEEDDIDVDF